MSSGRKSQRKSQRKTYPDATIYHDNATLLKIKLREGADPNFISETDNADKLPAISYAMAMRHKTVVDKVKYFIADKRTNINEPNSSGTTPLICACICLPDNIGAVVVELLLKHRDIKMNLQNKWGDTALHWACSNKKVKCVNLLINDSRLDVNVMSENTYTPLYLAVEKGHVECVKALLSCLSLNPNLLTKGETALHLAYKKGLKHIVIELLKDKRTDATIPDQDGNRVLAMITDTRLLAYLPTE